MIKTLIFLIIFFAGSHAYSQNDAAKELYILYESDHNLITKKTNQKSNTTSFEILRHKYRTEEQKDAYLKEYAESPYEPINSFVYTFVAPKEPKQKANIANFELTPIDSISHDKINIGPRTRIYFIEKVRGSETYLIYETLMEFYE